MNSQSDRRYRKNPDMVSRNLRGEHLIVPLSSSSGALDSIYTLNETAGFVWTKACEGLRVAEIIEAVTTNFVVDAGTSARDVSRILTELEGIGAIQPEATGS